MSLKTFVIVSCVIGSVYMQQNPPDRKEIYDKIAIASADANKINQLSGLLYVLGQGPFPLVIADINEICVLLKENLANENNSDYYYHSDKLVTMVCNLTDILIGKASLLNDLPLVRAPLADVLKLLEISAYYNVYELSPIPTSSSFSLTKLKYCMQQAIGAYTPVI